MPVKYEFLLTFNKPLFRLKPMQMRMTLCPSSPTPVCIYALYDHQHCRAETKKNRITQHLLHFITSQNFFVLNKQEHLGFALLSIKSTLTATPSSITLYSRCPIRVLLPTSTWPTITRFTTGFDASARFRILQTILLTLTQGEKSYICSSTALIRKIERLKKKIPIANV